MSDQLPQQTPAPPNRKSTNQSSSGGRDDRLDEDLDKERLEPGLNGEGTGSAGADPAATAAHERAE